MEFSCCSSSWDFQSFISLIYSSVEIKNPNAHKAFVLFYACFYQKQHSFRGCTHLQCSRNVFCHISDEVSVQAVDNAN
jgi:hypothetical protein